MSKPLDPATLAYMAGVFDCTGCVIYKAYPKQLYRTIVVDSTNETVVRLFESLGGHVGRYTTGWKWKISGKSSEEAARFLLGIPQLSITREWLIRYLEVSHVLGHGYDHKAKKLAENHVLAARPGNRAGGVHKPRRKK
jgi:hypothetical protein